MSIETWKAAQTQPETARPNSGDVDETRHAGRRLPGARLLVLLGVGAAIAGGAAAWFAFRGDGGTPALPAPNSGPTLVSQAQLGRLASSIDHPVYWAGPKPGFSYELTNSSSGRIFIRYLPSGVKAGDPRPDFLVVGTYTQSGSFRDLKQAGKQKGSVALGIGNGGVALFNTRRPSSVYFAYPGTRYQVEVYDPSGEAARQLVLGGQIRPLK